MGSRSGESNFNTPQRGRLVDHRSGEPAGVTHPERDRIRYAINIIPKTHRELTLPNM